jgi:hypothetical protein
VRACIYAQDLGAEALGLSVCNKGYVCGINWTTIAEKMPDLA